MSYPSQRLGVVHNGDTGVALIKIAILAILNIVPHPLRFDRCGPASMTRF